MTASTAAPHKNQPDNRINKKTYVLVHGAWHASWCWNAVIPLLEHQGHNVIAPDLPGHGRNLMPFKDITLQTYVDSISQQIMALEQPVVLVGHSMGGVVISQVAENFPEHTQALIYISAFVPTNRGSLLQEAEQCQTTGISSELAVDTEKKRIILKKNSKTRAFLFHDCPDTEAKYLTALLQETPLQPFIDGVTLSAKKFGRIKKTYITCLQDRVLPPIDQKRMYQRLGCEVIELNTGHSPFASEPKALARALLQK